MKVRILRFLVRVVAFATIVLSLMLSIGSSFNFTVASVRSSNIGVYASDGEDAGTSSTSEVLIAVPSYQASKNFTVNESAGQLIDWTALNMSGFNISVPGLYNSTTATIDVNIMNWTARPN